MHTETESIEVKPMTIRQLRQALFHLDNQEMTVRDLRSKLFAIEDQEQPIIVSIDMWRKLAIQ